MHYIDEGSIDSQPVLLLHGVPTWSYLFRKVIPILVKEGHRVIAIDLIGFGKSDKPTIKEIYTFDYLTQCLNLFIRELNLSNIVLFGHDWGALFGLRLAVENEPLFSGLIVSNGFVPKGKEKIPILFSLWKFITKYSPILPIGRLISFGSNNQLNGSEIKAYDLPFCNNNKMAVRVLPQLLPFEPNTHDYITAKAIWNKLEFWKKPLLTIFSNNDPVTRGGEKILQKYIPGGIGQNHQILDGGHFVPEDAPEEIGKAINQFIKTLV